MGISLSNTNVNEATLGIELGTLSNDLGASGTYSINSTSATVLDTFSIVGNKLSFSKKEVLGAETVNVNYNRPPIGPIKEGYYCTFCDNMGPEDHDEMCTFPEDDNKLNLTILFFFNHESYRT